MKILLCHNFYQQPGGEDQSFAAEADLLESHGHEIVRYTVHNDDIEGMSRAELVKRTFWNRDSFNNLRALIQRERPALLHATNIFPLISPAAYDAARAEGIPVVQSLRNYRLFCPGAYLARDGKVCESCLGKPVAWRSVVHRCYRKSRAASAVVAGMAAAHRLRGTWNRKVDLYFTLTEFSRQKCIAGGVPADKIVVKPNFIDPDPGVGPGNGNYAIFVGRLSAEKGLDTLLAAWQQLPHAIPLKIVGDGPLRAQVELAAQRNINITWLGRRSPDEVLTLVGDARFLVMPSVWYETFGRTIIEAFSRGTPVLASNLGAMAELVDSGSTGLLFTPGDVHDLGQKAQAFIDMNSDHIHTMRVAARDAFATRYTGTRNYDMLMDIYRRALDTRANTKAAHTPELTAPRISPLQNESE